MKFEEKFVAFVDVLGFKRIVESAESGGEFSLPMIMEILGTLGSEKHRAKYASYGPHICPESKSLSKNIGFELTQISDCVIVSSEISPAGVINLISHCWGAAAKLLTKGIMCRGYITRGKVFHTPTQIIGSGYQNAFESESGVEAFRRSADEIGTPFIEVAPSVVEYIEEETDECVKKVFNRMVKTDGPLVALYPFSRFSHSFVIGGIFGSFNSEKEKKANQVMREMLFSFREKVMGYVPSGNEKALQKVQHYVRALDVQIYECYKTDEMIEKLSGSLLRSGMKKVELAR